MHIKQISKEHFHTFTIDRKQNSVKYFVYAMKAWDYKLDASQNIVLYQNITGQMPCDQR